MSTRPAEITTTYGWAEALDGVRATRTGVSQTCTWIYARLNHYRDLQARNDTTEPETEKGTPSMNDDEQHRRDALQLAEQQQLQQDEEQQRQQHDLVADSVPDADDNPQPGDDGAPEPELEG